MFLSSDPATNEFYISICTLCTVCLQSIRFAEQCCDTQIVHVIVHHVLDKLHSYEFNSRPLLCPPEVKVPYFVLPRSRSLTLSCWGKGHLLCPAEVKFTYFVLLRSRSLTLSCWGKGHLLCPVGGLLITDKLITYKLISDKLITDKLITDKLITSLFR